MPSIHNETDAWRVEPHRHWLAGSSLLSTFRFDISPWGANHFLSRRWLLLILLKCIVGENEVPDSLSDVAVSLRKKGDFVTRSIAGETVVVPVKGQVGDLNAIYNLNEVGAFIWEQIDGRKTAIEFVEAVRGEFEVAPEEAEKETLEFIAALESAGMIEPSGSEVWNANRSPRNKTL